MAKAASLMKHKFDEQSLLNVGECDLIYDWVALSWNYISDLIDLHGFEFIGYSAGKKDSTLYQQHL